MLNILYEMIQKEREQKFIISQYLWKVQQNKTKKKRYTASLILYTPIFLYRINQFDLNTFVWLFVSLILSNTLHHHSLVEKHNFGLQCMFFKLIINKRNTIFQFIRKSKKTKYFSFSMGIDFYQNHATSFHLTMTRK